VELEGIMSKDSDLKKLYETYRRKFRETKREVKKDERIVKEYYNYKGRK